MKEMNLQTIFPDRKLPRLVQLSRERPHIVFLFSDTGGGHRSATQAVIEALELEYPSRTTHEMVDFFRDYAPPILDRAPEFYPPLSRQAAYGLMFHRSNSPERTRMVIKVLWPYIHENVKRLLREHPADLYVSVHPLINVPLAEGLGRNRRKVPFVTVVTDLVTAHAFWYSKGLDMIIVPSEAAFQRGIAFGIPPERMRVIGLPISTRYSQLCAIPGKFNRPMSRERLGWPQERLVVLLVGGGEGMGPLEEMARAIDSSGLPVKLVVVAGRNKKLKESLEQYAWQGPAEIHGFVENMPDFLRAADILVTKAGPGMISEALAAGLPMILYSRLDGQEEGNVGYVTESNAGIWAPQPEMVVQAIQSWLDHPEMRARAARACLSLARPHAALDIATVLMEQVGLR